MSNSLDHAYIYIESGKGGKGSAYLHREKFKPKGGPAGGNGGNGGNVYIEANTNYNNLLVYKNKVKHKAEDGVNGGNNNCTGARGKSITLQVPIGTQILDENNELIHDFIKPEKKLILTGGKGGLGNSMFKSSTNQTPRIGLPGFPGEAKNIQLVLKSLADIGIIGHPNCGKSTLIKHITNSKANVGNYEFTTIEPNLGILQLNNNRYTVCDIPGLIKGAAQGKGLGIKFLQHIERCKVLIHLIDGESTNIKQNYLDILHELKSYSDTLIAKPQIVCITKCENISDYQPIQNSFNFPVFFISSHQDIGITKILAECEKQIITLNNIT